MNIRERIDAIFPTLEQVEFRKDRNDSRLESAWLGISQMILNFPRALWSVFWPALSSTVVALMFLVLSWLAAIGAVLIFVFALPVAGLMGFAHRKPTPPSDAAFDPSTG